MPSKVYWDGKTDVTGWWMKVHTGKPVYWNGKDLVFLEDHSMVPTYDILTYIVLILTLSHTRQLPNYPIEGEWNIDKRQEATITIFDSPFCTDLNIEERLNVLPLYCHQLTYQGSIATGT
jgi:hypothetical protein